MTGTNAVDIPGAKRGRQKWQKVIIAYVIACVVSALFGALYSWCIPVAYTAEKVLVDESSEMDLVIGTNHFREWYREKAGFDRGVNNVEVYSQMLGSREFAEELSSIEIPGYGMTYLDYVKKYHKYPWWHCKGSIDDLEDALTRIQECIRYRAVAKDKKLIIQVADPDPVVSAILVDSVSSRLNQTISEKRRQLSLVLYESMADILENAKVRYEQLQAQASSYLEQHLNHFRAEEVSQYTTLTRQAKIANDTYQTVKLQYLRQKMLSERLFMSFYTLKEASVPLHPSNPQYLLNILAFMVIAVFFTTWAVLFKYVNNAGKPIQYGDMFSPWFITIGIWALILVGYYLQPGLLYPLKEQFFICLAVWIPVLCLSAFLTYNLLPRQAESSRRRIVTQPFNVLVFNFLFIISVAITPLYLYAILKIVSQFGTEDFISNIRIFAVHGNESFGYLSLSYVLNQALLIMALWRYPRIPLWQLLMVYCLALMNAFAIMEKGMLFYIVIVTLFVTYQKRLLRMRSVVLTLAVIVMVFFVINLFRTDDDSYAEETTLLDFVVMYVLSPPVAFGTLSQDISLQPGAHTFVAIYKLLNSWGLGNFAVGDRVQDFVYVPIPTNIYTVFQPFFEDFKYWGIAFFALVYGVFSGWLYRLYQNGDALGKIVYTYLVYVLILQFYQENLILNMVQFGHFVFLSFLVQQRFFGFNFAGRRV